MAVQPVEPGTASQAARLLSLEEFRAQLQATGEERYHHKHPFHLLMHEGKLSRGQLQAWALNRYYYQAIIPIKDAIILSRGPDPVFRRAWRKRIIDHDGDAANNNDGGIKRWVKLAEATGLDPEMVRAGKGILPATRFAVDEYLNIVRSRSLLEAVASSLTELL
jgi:coenzyme PQQ biosynthesis protein C